VNASRGLRRTAVAVVISMGVLMGLVSGPAPTSTAVVGGAPTDISAHPWQALVIAEPANRLCGGSIVDAGWILTAAHCVVGIQAADLDVHLGVSTLGARNSGNQVGISEVIVHPSWDESTFRNDVALLRLTAPVSFGDAASSIAPIRLPIGQDASSWPAAGTPATITGWGSTEFGGDPSNQLRAVQVQILGGPDQTQCGGYGSNFDVTTEICAGLPTGGADACQGDSGSPLVIDVAGIPVLAGVTSVGYECARAEYPGLFSRLTTFESWLMQYIPALSGPVSAPQQVTVASIAGERLRVAWQPPLAATTPVAYRAVTSPGDFACQVDGSINACVIEGVKAGGVYEVTVSAIDGTGGAAAANPVRAVGIDGVTSTGVRMRPKRLATWAGLKVARKDKIWLTVRPGSADVCRRVGKRKKPRFVRATNVGFCAVKVVVVKRTGAKKRAIAYVAVT